MNREITMHFDLPHPPAKVWRALTEPELLAKWLMTTDLRPVVGTAFTFKTQPSQWWDGIVTCEMQEVEPQKRIRYSWAGGGLEETVVTWTLEPTASGGTRLHLVHSGFGADASQNQFYEGAKGGWQFMGGQKLGVTLAEMS